MADDNKLREYLKYVTADLHETRQRLRAVEEAGREPIAIVGMACRYPGGVAGPEDLWDVVDGGRDAMSPFPANRGWDLDELRRRSQSQEGGFLPGADEFDAAFFGIAPREALAMDPQQRLFLETSWEALERAGIAPLSLQGSNTGTFAGCYGLDYCWSMSPAPQGYEGHLTTGGASSVVPGRVAYILGLQGPAVAVDTACSSSLVAVHLAAQALRAGDCALALVGGVSVMSTPLEFLGFSEQGGLAPDGRCKPFSERADGMSLAEGVGVLVLERLSDARRHGRRVLAVVRGSAVNQDGASNGLTAPNGPSQRRVIRAALANAGLLPADVDAVEAHGTGTRLGDPIEAQALLATYGRDRDRPLWLGSVKSNIGHTQAAAGVAGVIKMVEAMRRGVLPRTLHAEDPSSHVDWSAGAVALLDRARPWETAEDRPRRAAVSAFGISGTNAHVILEQAVDEPSPAGTWEHPLPLVVSTRSAAALRDQAARLAARLRDDPDLSLLDVAASLATGRAALDHRAVVVAADRAEALAGLDALHHGEPAANVLEGLATEPRRAVFVFPGQGSQWVGMASELLADSPVFAECERALAPLVDWSLQDALSDPELLEQVDVVQPVLWAVMVSLAAVWESHGVTPAAVIGHSQGEIAAAVVAGGLSIVDGARVVVLRSKALRAIAGKGGMVSVAAPVDRVRELIDGRLSVAAVNGPSATVVAGPVEALDEFMASCGEDIRVRRIPVDYASHTPQVEELREQILADLDGLSPVSGRVPFISAVTGEVLDTAQLDGTYWYTNLRQPVRFDDAVNAARELGLDGFIECSAHPVLALGVGTLRRDDGGMRRLVTSLGEAHNQGIGVDFGALLAGGRRVDLPTYAFQRERFWLSGDGSPGGDEPVVRLAHADAYLLTERLSLRTQPWLADHAVNGTVLLPGTAFVELALRAGQECGCPAVEELTIQAPLVLGGEDAVRVQVWISEPDADGRRPLTVHSRPDRDDAGWTVHAEGRLAPGAAAAPTGLAEWPPPGAEPLPVGDAYERFAANGYGYGPAFRGLRAAWRRGDDLFAEVRLPEPQQATAARYGLHPALLDAALHAGLLDPTGGPALPFAWTGVTLHGTGATGLRVRLSPAGPDAVTVVAADAAGEPVAVVERLVSRPLTDAGPAAGSDALFRVDWAALPVEERPEPAGWVVVGADDLGVTTALWAAGLAPTSAWDLPSLAEAVTAGAPAPDLVAASFTGLGGDTALDGGTGLGGDPIDAVHRVTAAGLELVQAWLSAEAFEAARLVVVTRGAAAPEPGRPVDLAGAALWGLLKSAQAEHPGRILLVDLDDTDESAAALAAVVSAAAAAREPQVAVRAGAARVPRLARAGADGDLRLPAGDGWVVEESGAGTADGLRVAESAAGGRPLEPGQVRVAVRAAGLNFRDVLIALGMYPGEARMGNEGAGVVVEAAPDVRNVAVGDRVAGLLPGSFGPVAVADARTVTRIPDGWSFERGASVPTCFLTAYYALVDLAGLRAGERVLVHAGAGGVGMAAVHLARQLGAEVFATASPAKWDVLRGLGLDDEHIASSRDLGFAERFPAVDVVLNSLAGDFVDASLGLLAEHGRFIEMGKTDVRVGLGPRYRAFDLQEAGPQRIGEMLAEVMASLEPALPVTVFDIRRAPEAFRYMSQARHVGKIVLRLPRPAWPTEGTVLVTGGTGTLGRLVARHLVTEHGVSDVLLVGRSGGAGEPDPRVRVAACDIADRDAVRRLLDTESVRAVVHLAGVLDDGTVESFTAERLGTVLRPKADGALILHELTAGRDLDAFVMFSSAASVLGSPGQGNYAAANAVLDALAHHRRAQGLPAQSLAWGLWQPTSALTGHLDDSAVARLMRGVSRPIAAEQGLALLDAAPAADAALLMAVPVDTTGLRRLALQGELPALARGLVRQAPRRAANDTAADGRALADRLAALGPADREREVTDLVRGHAAAVLVHASADAVDAHRPFKDLGFDSLTAVELRNRLGAATGVRLSATAVFDHPTPAELARHLLVALVGEAQPAPEEAAPVLAAADDPIVVVGMACRYPGEVASPEDLWRLVESEVDAIGPFPADRGWDLAGIYSPDPDRRGHTYAREGGFVQDAAMFDADLFGISPREALAMDPQQRLLLETTWEAMERAGIPPMSLRGSRTGVYVGAVASGYASDLRELPEGVDGYLGTGVSASVHSGRIAYAFGLEGPAVTVDTACSSSLVALHLATQALRNDECSLALASGVCVMPTPAEFIEFSRQRALSPGGRCRAFAEAADGTAFAEGVGVLVLARLSRARRLGYRIHAVVRGSAVNSDGASNGLTAPNGPSQQRVIRAALANAGLRPSDVDTVEAHGTGTSLGDPIEAQALLATYGQDRSEPLYVGSLKSNLGHTQAAAGVAGIIKMVEAMRHGVLPRTLHVDAPSSHVDWASGAVSLLTEAREWPALDRPRRAGVSSFGISGTNAHVILEQPPALNSDEEGKSPPEITLLPLSARTESALRAQAGRLRDFGDEPGDVAAALVRTRTALEHRAVVIGRDREELTAGLDALAGGGPSPAVVRGVADIAGRTVFVFPGQGSQWEGMAVELLDASPVFAARLAECDAALGAHLDWSVADVLRGAPGAPSIERIEVVQPVLFAVMVSLAALWRSQGIHPDAVVGSSQGEIAAACVAGALTLQDAAKVVVLRSRLFADELAGNGAVASVAAPADEVRARLARWGERLAVSGINGPRQVAVAGDLEALGEFVAACEADGLRARVVAATVASHCAQVDPLRERLTAMLEPLSPRRAEVPFWSTVTGEPMDTEGLDAQYWYWNARRPVELHAAVRALLADGHRIFVECSTHPVLTVALQDTAEEAGIAIAAAGTLRRGEGGPQRLLTSVAELYVRGVAVDWPALLGGPGERWVDLPTYAFDRRRYWLQGEPVLAGDPADEQFWAAIERGDLAGVADALQVPDGAALAPALPLLSGWRRRRRESSTVDGWRYRVEWEPLGGPAAAGLDGEWLLVEPESGLADGTSTAVAKALQSAGAEVRTITVAPEEAGRAALAARLRDAAPGARAVVSLLALDTRPLPAHPELPVGLAGTVTLTQALGDAGIEAPLWCLTRGAVHAGPADAPADPAQAQVWGFGRVAGLERPRAWGGLVDLPGGDLDPDALLAVLAGAGGEDQSMVPSQRRVGFAAVPMLRS
ncbi:beta-ketoacyl synthase N-terminal-like domain-containing protein [Dactylosporangium sp. NPDC051485]|uniref:beta-ketoacyl synthase N-terminal-like domain-containing protein n=1 Tax=Dactylosporangium sp. NPDC051485 TaxID=3154846 RepID=UPI00344042F7